MSANEEEIPLLISDDVNAPSETSEETPKLPALDREKMTAMFSQLMSDPDKVSQMMGESLKVMTPEMMNQAKKMAMGGQGQQIMRDMQKRGMNAQQLRDMAKEQKSKMKQTVKPINKPKKVLQIGSNRKVTVKTVEATTLKTSINQLINAKQLVELKCTRLAVGPLQHKTIRLWYDDAIKVTNRKATRLIGFPVGGIVYISMDEGDLKITDLEAVEAIIM